MEPKLPKVVVARLQASASLEHPDPDLLTAFAERSLRGPECEQLLSHLASCSECRQIIVLASREGNPDSTSAIAAIRPGWLRTPVLRWGAVAACVVVVSTAVLLHKREQASPPRGTELATQQPGASVVAPKAEPSRSKPMAASAIATAKSQKSPAVASSAPQEVASARMSQPAGMPAAPGAPFSASAADLASRADSLEAQGAAPAVPQAAPGANQNQPFRANNSNAAKAAPVFTPRPTTETAASTMGGAARLSDMRAPNWRLSQDGLPERSFTSGQWEKVQVDHRKGFRALAFQGMDVWIGGPAGLLYHSEDMGLNWTRIIPVTESATLSDNVASIAFTDHLHGTVATETGQTWVTSDAGKSWELK